MTTSTPARGRRVALLACTALATAVATVAGAPGAARAQAQPPAPGTPKELRLPTKRVVTLDNGMRLVLVPFGAVPRAYVQLAVRTGMIDEPRDGTGLAQITATMLDQGTATRDARQIADEAASMGGNVAAGAGADVTNVGGEVLAEHAAPFVTLVADLVRNPSFPADQFARVRTDAVRRRAIALSQPGEIARERFRAVMYGDHPYGRLWASEAELQGYTPERARAFHAANFGARRATLYVVGQFDAAAVERAAREAFGTWAAGTAATVNPPKPRAQRSLTLVDRPGAVQSTINMGVPVADPSHADYTALEVTDALLGGSFGSRITSNIREQKGYTYSPYSQVSTRYRDSHWAEVADVTTDKTGASLTEIFGEVDRLRREAPPPQELKGIQNYVAGVFTLRNGSRGGVANQLQFLDVHGLPDTYLTGYVGRVMATSPDDVRRIAETYLAPERMTLVVVGDKQTVEAQVAPFASERCVAASSAISAISATARRRSSRRSPGRSSCRRCAGRAGRRR
ncbi:MAG TPA: pitrilysin family protein [Gemmatirosa sp.]|nr:pitrilysin family protein [Gemmatirosa sp.]